jgi:enoyl-CoA hydratase/carnithine racemase
MGLVNRVVPKSRLLETAEEIAKKIASFHPMAVRNAKQAVLRGLDLSLSEGLELERRLALELRGFKRE